MVNINLSTSNEEQKSILFPPKKVALLVLVVVIWLGAYAGVSFYKSSLEKKTQAIAEEQLQKEKSVKEGKNKDIFDFQTRLTLANSLVGKKSDVVESLNKIQELMVSGVYLSSYEYDKKENLVVLTSETNDYSSMARQILNFKKSAYLSNVKISDIDSKEGKIGFAVSATINNQNVK